jgi:hypothetical protein
MYELVNLTNLLSLGSFDDISEARGVVEAEALKNWAIYRATDDSIVEWSREPWVGISATNPRALISTIRGGDGR